MKNRIQAHGTCLESSPRSLRASHGSLRASHGAALLEPSAADECTLFAPLHYEANYAYPLIVWLHGAGESDRVLTRIMPHVSLRNYAAVAPRGTQPSRRASRIDGATAAFGWRQTTEQIYTAQVRVANAIEKAAAELTIHRQRIFLAGSGCGGTMALRVAMDNPNRYAGALSLDGSFPRGGAPLQRLVEARQIPLFIARARKSKAYGSEIACDDLRLLYAAGMSLTLKEYPGADVCRPQVLGDIDRWIMEVLAEQTQAPVVASSRRVS